MRPDMLYHPAQMGCRIHTGVTGLRCYLELSAIKYEWLRGCFIRALLLLDMLSC